MMGMTIKVDIADRSATSEALKKVFDYFTYVDEKFSTYKETSEISAINSGKLKESEYSEEMKEVLHHCEETKALTRGYFDIKNPKGKLDPSGLVKGWAIYNAYKILKKDGYKNFYIDAGGDIQTAGLNQDGKPWSIGLRNPFNPEKEIVKVVYLKDDMAVATSGTYARGQHIYNPHSIGQPILDVISLTVLGPNVYEVDRFATAAFAMGLGGIRFVEGLKGFEGYSIDAGGTATMTSGFDKYTKI